MKKIILLIIPVFLFAILTKAQNTIVYRDFESSADNWNYTIYPNAYNVSGDVWDSVTSVGSISNAQSGSYFWGMRDLDNPNGGGPFRHRLTMETIDISLYSNVTVSFYYYTDGYDGTDSIFYNIQYDNGSNWPVTDDIELNKDTDAWTQVSIPVPAGTQYVRLQLSARQNGGSDYAGFDNIVLSGTIAGGVNNPSDFDASTVSTSEIDLSWTRNSDLDSVMVVKSYDNVFGTPVDGEYYAAGDVIPGGDTVLCRQYADTTYQHTGLNAGEMWHYKAWSVNASLTYSSGVADSASTYKNEPSNHVSAFTTGTPTPTSIPLTWMDNDGTVVADSFLIMINTTGNFTAPVDGTPQADDTDVSDGSGQVNVAHGTEAYIWTGLSQNTHYYFTIYPYTNSGSAIDYKTDGAVPTADETTTSASTDLIISEVADPGDYYKGRYVEIYNVGANTIDFSSETWYICRQANGSSSSWADIQLSGTINSGEAFTIAYSATEFHNSYGINPDMADGGITGSGDDGYFLYYGGDHTSGALIDAYGVIDEDGTGKDWEYTNSKAVRKRSVATPNTIWTASEWVITSADTVNMTPGEHFNYVSWLGSTDQYWDTKSNWDNGFIPDASMNVTIPDISSTFPPEVNGFAECWDLSLLSLGQLTVNPTKKITVYGDLSIATSKSRAAADFIIESDNTGQGSLIVEGSISGNAYVRSYVTAGKWHSITSPVSSATADSYYLGGSPDVWLKEYSEATNSYTYITDLTTPLGDMKGWMIWIDGSTAQTFTLNGPLRSGPVGSNNNMVCTYDTTGYNFVGNPYTSALDWDASSGWTKTNLEDAIYVYNNGNWATYVSGTGANGGSQYIAMNQGFFVRVDTTGSSFPKYGTLIISRDACVHNNVSFLKSAKAGNENEVLRLEVDNGSLSDETVIRIKASATEGWDKNLDAHKLFSFNTNRPQIYSTANGFMSINSIPPETGSVELDVRGVNYGNMTIKATSYNGFAHVYLTDKLNGITTDLTRSNYSFVYVQNVTDRFTVSFTVTSTEENKTAGNYYTIYGGKGIIRVLQPSGNKMQVAVYDMLGRKIAGNKTNDCYQSYNINNPGYYIVHVTGPTHNETKKVFVE